VQPDDVVTSARQRTISTRDEEIVPEPVAMTNARIRNNMLRTALGNLALPAAVFATAPILARSLGVTGRGELAAASAPLLLMTTVGTIGIPDAITFLIARQPRLARLAIRRGAALLAAAGFLAMIATVAMAKVISDHRPNVEHLIVLTSVTIVPVLMVGALRGAAGALHQWKLVNREKYISSLLRAGGIVVLVGINRLTVSSGAIVIALSALLAVVAYLPLRRLTGSAGEVTAPGLTGELASYGSKAWVGSLSGILLSRLDQTIMSPLAGATQLGLYATAVNISDVTLLVNSAVRDVTFAADASAHSTERLTRTARVSFLASILLGVAICGSLPLWLSPLFGAGFATAQPATIILIAGSVLGVPGSIAGAGLSSRGRPGLRSAALVVACITNVVLLFLLVAQPSRHSSATQWRHRWACSSRAESVRSARATSS
jgi:O-antigen/teichoic acid export membrane protein